MADLSITLAGVRFPNPVMPASGTFEPFNEDSIMFDPRLLGAIINKTIFLEPRAGNPPPRIWETPCGMLNSIGIPSEGVEQFVRTTLPKMKALGIPVVVSIAGNTVDEFCSIAELIDRTEKADLIELDLSCPNIHGGTQWATESKALETVVSRVVRSCSLPVIAKLSPSVADISEMATCAENAGAAVLSMINTFKGMAIDVSSGKPILGNTSGGLSGPAIRPLAVYAVYSCYRKVKVPIIGMGGISSGWDAVEFFLAGASAVAVGMYNFVKPNIMPEIIRFIESYLQEYHYQAVTDIVGLAHKSEAP
jgi:dihydroorotate dehydrogenase (NAD+) catalytic subunit